MTVGVWFGLLCRALLAALHEIGMVLTMQSGMGAAMLFDPMQNTQSSIIGSFCALAGTTLLLSSGLHSYVLRSICASYAVFPLETPVPLVDMSHVMVHYMGRSLAIALQCTAPLWIAGLMVTVIGGIMGRVLPQLQVFFVAMPAQMLLLYALLAMVFGPMLWWYASQVLNILQSMGVAKQ
jgi:flagellar biosynthetic protein FliR